METLQLIEEHPTTDKTTIRVRFNDFGESSLNILVYFHLETTEYSAELEAREEILLSIMDLAAELGVDFAFPTRTLVIETPPAPDPELSGNPSWRSPYPGNSAMRRSQFR